MTDRSIIGQKIAFLRKMKGLTQAELAEQLGVSPQAVSQWERSETMPDILTLPRIAEIFDENISAILGLEELNAEKAPEEIAETEETQNRPDDETAEEYYDRLAEEVEANEEEYDRLAAEAEANEPAHTITVPEVNIPEINIPEIRLPTGEVIPAQHIPGQTIPAQKIEIPPVPPVPPKPPIPPAPEEDPLLPKAIEILRETGKASSSLLQRKLTCGYGRATRLLERLEALGYIGPENGFKPREVFLKTKTPDRSNTQIDVSGFTLPVSEYTLDFADPDEEYEIALIKDGKIVNQFKGSPNEFVRVVINGDVKSLRSSISVCVNGNVTGESSSGFDTTINGEVMGNPHSNMNMTCGNVTGDAHANMTLNCGDVFGNASANMSLNCNNIGGDAHANMSVHASGTIGGGKPKKEEIAADSDDEISVDGQNVTINGDYEGDLSAACSIVINGDVNGDIDTTGAVTVSDGDINGDVDTTGNVTAGGDINGDVDTTQTVMAGGDINGDVDTSADVNVGGDVDGDIRTDGDVNIGGDVGGDVTADGDVEVDGDVNGDITTDGAVTVHGDANGDIEAEKVKVYGTANNYEEDDD